MYRYACMHARKHIKYTDMCIHSQIVIMQKAHLIFARRPDLMIVKKKKKKNHCRIVNLAILADHRVKLKESPKKDKYLDLAREPTASDTNCNCCAQYNHQMFGTGTGGLGNKRMSGDHPKLQHFWDRPVYWEESWRLEETCCHSNYCEKPSANAGVKNAQKRKIIVSFNISSKQCRKLTIGN